MKQAYVFPGQGAQFPGMGKDLYTQHTKAKEMIEEANDILGFDIQSIMFEGSEEELKQTKVTQPAIFIHSTVAALNAEDFAPDMVAGHSLGEFSALVANGALEYGDALRLVAQRATAMQAACEQQASTMAAVLGLDDEVVEEVCKNMEGIVVAANYNCPGQLVISGAVQAVSDACDILKEKGARRAMLLPVGGAFHSPLMESARAELESAIQQTTFKQPTAPVYQNVDAQPYQDVEAIKKNLILQLTAPVRWTQCVQNMIKDGATLFVECGPGKVLQGLVKKIDREMEVKGIS